MNIVLDFVLNLTTTTMLYLGHKPTNVMIESRTKKQFDKRRNKELAKRNDHQARCKNVVSTDLPTKILRTVLAYEPLYRY